MTKPMFHTKMPMRERIKSKSNSPEKPNFVVVCIHHRGNKQCGEEFKGCFIMETITNLTEHSIKIHKSIVHGDLMRINEDGSRELVPYSLLNWMTKD